MILAQLALCANTVVASDALIDALWGERPPPTAAKALQVHISQLRKLLEAGGTVAADARVLVTSPPGYRLQLADEDLDSRRFERLVGEGTAALRRGASELAARTLGEALGLWRGPPLGDLRDDDFAQPAARRLDELRLTALEGRIEAELELGVGGLAGELEGLVAEHPLRERLRRQLMLALYRDDRQVEALEAYRDGRRALVEELGLEPSEGLQRLHEQILRQDPALRPAEHAVGVRDAPADDFVGRERELGRLETLLEQAIAGHGGVVLLAGEPGAGKTRLAERLAAEARRRGALTLAGRCWEAGGAPAYWPWVETLRAYLRRVEPGAVRLEIGSGAAEIARLLPELEEFFPDLPPVPPATSDGARFRLFDAVGRFLTAAAAARPLVLVLDDLHAADTPSLLLLQFLARELGDARVLVVATYRDTEVPAGGDLAAALPELARDGSGSRVRLGGLTEPDIARLVEAIAGVAPAAAATRLILAETEGNPLFVGEMVRLLVSEGQLDAAAQATSWDFGIPDELRDVVSRRLRHLSEAAREVLAVASVLGRDVRLDALELIMGEDARGQVADALDEAALARLVISAPGPRARRRFSHAVIRDVIYDGLRSADRRSLHTRAGEALELLHRNDVDAHSAELAHHFGAAAAAGGESDAAVRYARRAGDQAARMVAFEEAGRLFELALETLGPSGEPATRCDVLLSLGDVLGRAGDGPGAKTRFRQAADIARQAAMPERLARAALGYGGRFLWIRSHTDPHLLPLLDDAVDALGDREDPLRVRLLARLAGALRPGSGRAVETTANDRTEAVQLADRAVAIARRLGNNETLAYALEGRVLASWAPGNAGERVRMAEEIIALSEAAGDKERAFAGHEHAHPSLWELGDPSGTAAEFEAMSVLAAELGQPAQQWMVACAGAIAALSQGRLADAERLTGDALALGRRAVTWNALVSHQMHTFMLRRAQGRLEEVDESLRSAVGEYPTYVVLRCALLGLDCELGHDVLARQALEELVRDDAIAVPEDEDWLLGTTLMADACAHLEDRRRAELLYDALLPHAGLVAFSPPDGCNDSVARSLGLLALTLGRREHAIDHFRHAIEVDTRMGALPAVARSRAELERALAGRSRR